MSTSNAVAIPDYSMAIASRFIGHELGVSGWIRVDQEGIDQAACAGDRQWTHVGVECARRESLGRASGGRADAAQAQRRAEDPVLKR
jgi:acyl dehydratase